VAERLTFWTSRRLAAPVPRDLVSVSSADVRSSIPDRSVVEVPGSSPASCESILANEKESNLPVLQLRIPTAISWSLSVGPRALVLVRLHVVLLLFDAHKPRRDHRHVVIYIKKVS